MSVNLEFSPLLLNVGKVIKMDHLSMQQVPSANQGYTQPPTTNKQVSQIDLLPRFQNTTSINVHKPHFSMTSNHFTQDQFPGSVSGDYRKYQQMPLNVRPLQMEAPPTLQTPISSYLSSRPSLLDRQANKLNKPGLLPTSSNKRIVPFLTSPKVPAAVCVNGVGLQQLSATNKRPASAEQPSKAKTESFESVRVKLRESLAAALAMVSPQKCKLESGGVIIDSSRRIEMGKNPVESNTIGTNFSLENTQETLSSNEPAENECQSLELVPKENGQLESSSTVSSDVLLQGHGLSWVSDVSDCGEAKSYHILKKPKFIVSEQPKDLKGVSASQDLAFKIEAELFKFHGGVNKKYREKGRSLLFNLKDPNNPELRERVLSGDIPPERLCSMTAEELASKELTQWRLAKAQELAEMVVLPESEVDMRRLVKKTHKGEIQIVEAEQDDSISVEVGLGATMVSQAPKKSKVGESQGKKSRTKSQVSSKSGGARSSHVGSHAKNDLGDEVANELDSKNDLMQELMAHEIKDVEFLPQIVSLDEFMEALDSEPPFENLSVDKADYVPESEHSNSTELEVNNVSVDVEPKMDVKSDSPRSPVDNSKTFISSKLDLGDGPSVEPAECNDGNTIKADVEDTSFEGKSNSGPDHTETVAKSPDMGSKSDNIWEGSIQLSISSLVTVVCVFKSGEKTSTNEWPNMVEIKGRVKLDAFEKFLKELPLSRSRAIMIVQFCLKEESPDGGRLNLSEVADSYISDGRLGFAEPAPGMELYLCPHHERTSEMLGKYLPKEDVEALRLANSGLIGVVVWRRPSSLISPRPSSYHKRGTSKKHFSIRHGANGGTSGSTSRTRVAPPPPVVLEEAVDDVPPGFGPDAIDDDLPEFEYVSSNSHGASRGHGPSGSPRPLLPARPVEQMRELVYKYGKVDNSKKPLLDSHRTWNDHVDDDDDIPEWKPHKNEQRLQPTPNPTPAPLHPPQQPTLLNPFQQQNSYNMILPVFSQKNVQNPTFIPQPPAFFQPQPGLLHIQQNPQPNWQNAPSLWPQVGVAGHPGWPQFGVLPPPDGDGASVPPGMGYGQQN